MAETFNFDFFQIPHVGVGEPDLDSQTRTDVKVAIRRPVDMKMSNFGSKNVGARMSTDYSRTVLSFKSKDELGDMNVLTENAGVGSNVGVRGTTVNHNPLLSGSTVKYTRDDQFIRMTMSKDTGDNTTATYVGFPSFDVMDTNTTSAAGIVADANAAVKNWPSEGFRSFGGKYDFLPYTG